MKAYTITDGAGLQAVILPEKGATVVALNKDGVEYLYRDQENLLSAERPRCGIPFLFPIFGRLQNGVYTWDGREYAMAIHGFAHTSAWQVAEHTEACLKLVLESREETLAVYPFRFRVTLEIVAEEGSLTIGQTYENLGDSPMPYNYGFHPYFLTEDPEEIRVDTTAQTLFDFAEGAKPFGSGSVGVTMAPGAPEAGAALMGVTGPTALNWRDGRTLTMEFDDSFHTHVLWAQAGKRFLCVEPVNGSANGLNTGNYLTLLPGQKKTAFVRLRPEMR
ncbi:MAG: hypothetical protein IJN67_01840 [Oscillospiraceae bacterium]|nr:hypothetical protein [Oscillospiraceae bacterium]